MGTYDRDYAKSRREPGGRSLRFGIAPPTPVVLRLLVANGAIFFLGALIPTLGRLLVEWFAVIPASLALSLQVWRPITYQFLHAGLGHLFMNMLVLFFFGPIMERLWGGRRFLLFYLSCGAAGGILYTLMVLVEVPGINPGTLVGASGAIYGILVAVAILFPRMKVYVFGIFPLSMMILVPLLIAFSLFNIQSRNNVGGELAHLAGMVTGAVWLFGPPYFAQMLQTWESDKTRRQWEAQQNFQREVDRILDKVNHSGMESLSSSERATLEQASKQRPKHR